MIRRLLALVSHVRQGHRVGCETCARRESMSQGIAAWRAIHEPWPLPEVTEAQWRAIERKAGG